MISANGKLPNAINKSSCTSIRCQPGLRRRNAMVERAQPHPERRIRKLKEIHLDSHWIKN